MAAFERQTLPNGLRVLTGTVPQAQSTCVMVMYAVGSRYENADTGGISHFAEHLFFKGTERRPTARHIATEIDGIGAEFNAFTGKEYTGYYVKCAKEHVPVAVDVLGDMLLHSLFDPAEIERERTVVLQEIGQAEDTPDDIVFDHFQATAFPDQPMGRPVLGRAEIVGNMQGATIADYMRRHYGPERLVLAAAGQVDHEALVELARQAFTDLASSGAHAPEPARYTGGESRSERDLEQVHLVLGLPGVSYLDPDFYALGILSTLFGGGMSSRLFQEIREKRGLVYSIYSFNSAFRDGGIFGVYAGTGEKDAEEILPLVIEELRRLPASLTVDELERARAQARAGVLMARESTSNRAEQLASHILTHGRPLSPDEIMQRIEAVDAAQLGRVAHRLMSGRPTLAALGPLGRLARLDSVAGRLAA